MELQNFKDFINKPGITEIPVKQGKGLIIGSVPIIIFILWHLLAHSLGYFTTGFYPIGVMFFLIFALIIILIEVYILCDKPVSKFEHCQYNYKHIYNYYNKNKKSIFNPELFEALAFPDVRLDINSKEIYFENRDITKSLIKYQTLEEQIEYIQSLRVKI